MTEEQVRAICKASGVTPRLAKRGDRQYIYIARRVGKQVRTSYICRGALLKDINEATLREQITEFLATLQSEVNTPRPQTNPIPKKLHLPNTQQEPIPYSGQSSAVTLEPTLSFRDEVVPKLFRLISAGDSCSVVGIPGIGKSYLLNFMQRTKVQQEALGNLSSFFLLVTIDCNRLTGPSEVEFYELLLASLVEACESQDATLAISNELATIHAQVIDNPNPLLARRLVERACRRLYEKHGTSLCIAFDHFDQVYKALSAQLLLNLRALRDGSKYRLCYILWLRDYPARLRPPIEVEAFYELIAHSIVQLEPYTVNDANQMLISLETRWRHSLTPAERTTLMQLSGGHAGLLIGLFNTIAIKGIDIQEAQTWAFEQPGIVEQLSKIWGNVPLEEKRAIQMIAGGLYTTELRTNKGLWFGDPPRLFSPLFARYVLQQTANSEGIVIAPALRQVWIDGRVLNRPLSPLEFNLLVYLTRNAGQVCRREDIMRELYADQLYDANDERLDTILRRLREALGDDARNPRYITTVRGVGIRLIQGHVQD